MTAGRETADASLLRRVHALDMRGSKHAPMGGRVVCIVVGHIGTPSDDYRHYEYLTVPEAEALRAELGRVLDGTAAPGMSDQPGNAAPAPMTPEAGEAPGPNFSRRRQE